jgi:drug/metabolite transporter (DMT)-like permease
MMPKVPALITSGVMGLLMAGGSSLANAVADALRKKAVAGNDAIATAFWFRVVGVTAYVAIWLGYAMLGHGGQFAPQIAMALGRDAHSVVSMRSVAVYLAADVALIAIATALYFRAVQQSPLSVTIPMLSFTPVFLLPAGFLMLGEAPTMAQIVGVVLVAGGSILIHGNQQRGQASEDSVNTLRTRLRALQTALMRDRGSQAMLVVALIYSVTNPLDKKLVGHYGAYLYATIYSAASAVILLGWQLMQEARRLQLTRKAWPWTAAAGVTDAISLLLLFLAFQWTQVASAITVKRSGAIITVLLGWMFFRETHLASRLAATCIMILGVCLLSLRVTTWEMFLIVTLSLGLLIGQSCLGSRLS